MVVGDSPGYPSRYPRCTGRAQICVAELDVSVRGDGGEKGAGTHQTLCTVVVAVVEAAVVVVTARRTMGGVRWWWWEGREVWHDLCHCFPIWQGRNMVYVAFNL